MDLAGAYFLPSGVPVLATTLVKRVDSLIGRESTSP
jgi:hypothetical protein